MLAAATTPAQAWLHKLELRQLDAAVARVGPVAGARDIIGFASLPRNRDQIAQLLQPLIGRRVRVEIDPSPARAPGQSRLQLGTAGGSAPPGEQDNGVGRSDAAGPSSPRQSSDTQPPRSLTAEERDAAMGTPTVKELQRYFDVTLIEARRVERSDD